ncbi:hypothetical protein WBP06_04200 [Novosphingobium sp. BL-8H]|uniref:hypothetical protein n=1 Tax=Novosphingobium sp. BL-8H TaxID=3127640 RepID=UPI003757356B
MQQLEPLALDGCAQPSVLPASELPRRLGQIWASIWSGRDDSFDVPFAKVGTVDVGIVAVSCEQSVISFAVCSLAARQKEGERPIAHLRVRWARSVCDGCQSFAVLARSTRPNRSQRQKTPLSTVGKADLLAEIKDRAAGKQLGAGVHGDFPLSWLHAVATGRNPRFAALLCQRLRLSWLGRQDSKIQYNYLNIIIMYENLIFDYHQCILHVCDQKWDSLGLYETFPAFRQDLFDADYPLFQLRTDVS